MKPKRIAIVVVAALACLGLSQQAQAVVFALDVNEALSALNIEVDVGGLIQADDVADMSGTVYVDTEIPPLTSEFPTAEVFLSDVQFNLLIINATLTDAAFSLTSTLGPAAVTPGTGEFSMDGVELELYQGILDYSIDTLDLSATPLSVTLTAADVAYLELVPGVKNHDLKLTIPVDVQLELDAGIGIPIFVNLTGQLVAVDENVPEPGSIVIWSLLGLAAAGGTWWRRRRKA